jgi:hypothetical protein
MKNKNLLNLFLTFLLVLFLFFATLWANVTVRALAFLLSTYLVVWVFRRFGALNPMVWFPPFLFAYMSLYPLAAGTLPQWGDPQALEEVLSVGMLSLAGFFFGAALPCFKHMNYQDIDFNLRITKHILINTIFACLLITIYAAVFIQSAVKDEFKAEAGWLTALFPLYTFLSVILSVYLYQRYNNFGMSVYLILRDRFFVATVFVMFFKYSVSGEREAIFYLLLLLSLLYWNGKKNFWPSQMFFLVGAIMVVAPFAQYMKMFGRQDWSVLAEQLQYSILSNEFISAGRNTFFVLSNFDGIYLYGETFWWSLMRYFDVFFPEAQSAGAWFNTEFRSLYGSSSVSGWGFSFAAEGYINFGYLGVFAIYALKGVFISVAYRLSSRGRGTYVFYLLTIPTMVYIIRGDLASLLALSFKYNLVFSTIIFLAYSFKPARYSRVT